MSNCLAKSWYGKSNQFGTRKSFEWLFQNRAGECFGVSFCDGPDVIRNWENIIDVKANESRQCLRATFAIVEIVVAGEREPSIGVKDRQRQKVFRESRIALIEIT